MTKFAKRLSALALSGVMAVSEGAASIFGASAVQPFTSCKMYTDGEPAPMGMDDGCIADWSYDYSNQTLTIELQDYTYLLINGYITSISTEHDNYTDLIDGSIIELYFPIDPSEDTGILDAEVTFGGQLGTLIDIGLIPMDNPMDIQIVLE